MIRIDRKKLLHPLTLFKYAVLFFFLLLQFILIFLKKHDTLDLDIYPNTIPTQLIYGAQTVGQTFVAESDHLCRVDIMMGTLGRQNDRDLVFKLHQLGETATAVRTTTVNASGLLDNLYNAFVFEPVRKSKDQAFSLTLSSPGSRPENSVCAWMNARDIYRKGTILVNGAPVRGDLVFRVYAKRPVFTELQRILKNNPGILGKKWFLILCLCFFEGLSFLVLVKLLNLFILSLKKQD